MVLIKGHKPWNKVKGGLKGELNPFFGRTHSIEQKIKWSLMRKGKPSPFRGKKMSEEQKRKLSLSHKGKRISINTEFKKGLIPWNKGKTIKEDSRIARPWLNKKIPREYIIKSIKSRIGKYIGENSPNWKGGLTSKNRLEREKFRKYFQKKVFERDNYTCQLCGVKNGDGKTISLQVDHIQSWAEYVKLRFSMKNCRTVCAECHYEITFGKPMPPKVKGWGHHFIERRILQ